MKKTTPRRKLAAILAADIVGFSKMMGENEEGTLRNLKDILGEDKDYMQPAEFVIDCNIKKVIHCTYSDGGMGRIDAGDVVGFLSGIEDKRDEVPHVWSW